MQQPTIIIGAGAAGLMAGLELTTAGHPVIILEAAAHPGGRMNTRTEPGFSAPVEAGAEFIHGHLPLTLGLLDAAGIGYRPVKGRMQRVFHGEWVKEDWFDEDWDQLMTAMSQLTTDISVAGFLTAHFNDPRYARLRESVKKFAEGYDLADIDKASTLALYEEWQDEGGTEYRIDGGYDRMVRYMIDRCETGGSQVHCAKPVTEIKWQEGQVTVTTATGEKFTGNRLIITCSLGVLQQQPFSIQVTPAIPAQLDAARKMGFGSVIKILAQWKTAFWQDRGGDLGFILSDEPVPTWWTQYPDEHHLLTGWLAASAMHSFQTLDQPGKIESCIQSLSAIFGIPAETLRAGLETISFYDWTHMPYIQGGYSYETVEGHSARQLLQTPLLNTLFFAGEALYQGGSPATVEAALHSGAAVAKKIKALS